MGQGWSSGTGTPGRGAGSPACPGVSGILLFLKPKVLHLGDPQSQVMGMSRSPWSWWGGDSGVAAPGMCGVRAGLGF